MRWELIASLLLIKQYNYDVGFIMQSTKKHYTVLKVAEKVETLVGCTMEFVF